MFVLKLNPFTFVAGEGLNTLQTLIYLIVDFTALEVDAMLPARLGMRPWFRARTTLICASFRCDYKWSYRKTT